MSRNVIVNMFSHAVAFVTLSAVILSTIAVSSQTVLKNATLLEAAPKIESFEELLKRPVEITPQLKGVHPRLFFKAGDVPALREKAAGVGGELWRETLKDIQTLRRPAPDPKDEDLYKSGLDKRKPGSVTQYAQAFQISQTTLAYLIEQDERYLKAAKEWTLAACEMPIWGYTYNKPNVDLPPAHLLYAVAFAYDALYDKLSAAERETIRNKLVKQGRVCT